MQFVVNAHDGENMFEKRREVRPRHLENMASHREHVICAGGILNEEGKPVGSALVLDFSTREELDAYLAKEPYIIEKVWEDVRIEPLNVVIINGEKVGK